MADSFLEGFPVTRLLRNAVLASLMAALPPTVSAQGGAEPPTPEQLAARERVRPKVEAIFADMKAPWNPNDDHSHYFADTTDALIALGPNVVPFLVAEIELFDPMTYHYCAYALGRLGGADAEAALRKAYRRAVERKGPFGAACERFALYGLALQGKPDVVDLIQSGLPVQGLEQLPDLPLMTHVATLTAPANVPLLLKQLETYGADPSQKDNLRWAVTALGRSGDAAVAPRLVALLDHSSPGVRAAAAEALSRVGGPSACVALFAHLGGPLIKIDYAVSAGIERLKSDVCAKETLARLGVETDLEVRSALYRTAIALTGEGALPALRDGFERGTPLERADVAAFLGQLGSRKGLTLLRGALADKDPDVVRASVDAIGLVGGPGAVDTLEALVADPRLSVALLACRGLTRLGETKAAPRIAERLLSIVREPVGDVTLRPDISELSESLVTLGFVAAREDVATAAEVQSDPVIRDILRSCAGRLGRIAAAEDRPEAWAEALADTAPAVRRLAALRLAAIGSPAAIQMLRARFEKSDASAEDRAIVLRAVAEARPPGASDLVVRALEDPALDSWPNDSVRREAAWAARRIGGERMIKLLKAAAERRDGRDFATLAYLAVLEPAGTSDLMRRLRTKRLRYPEPKFGHEDALLDVIVAYAAHGLAPRTFDVPPEILLEM